jgi:hypothetical protein
MTFADPQPTRQLVRRQPSEGGKGYGMPVRPGEQDVGQADMNEECTGMI